MESNVYQNRTYQKKTFARALVLKLFHKLVYGSLKVIDPIETMQFGCIDTKDFVVLTIQDMKVYQDLILHGSLGFANSYIKSDMEISSLTAAIQLFIKNREIVDAIDGSFFGFISRSILTGLYKLSKNSIKQSKKHILAHYDLGNEFFSHFLDPSMMYSCAIYPSEQSSLKEASLNKIRRIIDQLQLSKDHHLVEIGTGWGSLAIQAHLQTGCRVTTTTISDKQHDYVAAKLQRLGLNEKVTLLKQDYRLLQGRYDRVVSVEMIEAVGYQYYHNYFQKCNDLLKDNGLLFLQAILIRDNQFERAKKEVDFIKKYIFPGSCIPSLTEIMRHVAKTDLVLECLTDLTSHYAKTLNDWKQRFYQQKDKIMHLGFDESFIRTWLYYFSYCEAGFLEKSILEQHLLFSKKVYTHAA